MCGPSIHCGSLNWDALAESTNEDEADGEEQMGQEVRQGCKVAADQNSSVFPTYAHPAAPKPHNISCNLGNENSAQ